MWERMEIPGTMDSPPQLAPLAPTGQKSAIHCRPSPFPSRVRGSPAQRARIAVRSARRPVIVGEGEHPSQAGQTGHQSPESAIPGKRGRIRASNAPRRAMVLRFAGPLLHRQRCIFAPFSSVVYLLLPRSSCAPTRSYALLRASTGSGCSRSPAPLQASLL